MTEIRPRWEKKWVVFFFPTKLKFLKPPWTFCSCVREARVNYMKIVGGGELGKERDWSNIKKSKEKTKKSGRKDLDIVE